MVVAAYTDGTLPPVLVEILCYSILSEWVYIEFVYDREFGRSCVHQDDLSNICEVDEEQDK